MYIDNYEKYINMFDVGFLRFLPSMMDKTEKHFVYLISLKKMARMHVRLLEILKKKYNLDNISTSSLRSSPLRYMHRLRIECIKIQTKIVLI